MPGGIIYALVARTTHVLAEYTAQGLTGNFSTVTRVLLKKIPAQDSKLSYIYDNFVFHYMVLNEITYLCMTDRQFNRVSAFQFLNEIKNRFVASYGDRAKTAIAFAFNAEFQRVLQQQMESFNTKKGTDEKLAKLRDEVEQVKDIMIDNIDRVLENRERIELLVDRAEILEDSAGRFKKQSTNLKRAMWWKNVKLMLLILCVLVILIYIILAASCGGMSLPKCS